MSRVLVVSGSPSPNSRTAAVLNRVTLRLTCEGHDVDQLSLRTLPAEPLLLGDPADPFLRDAADRLANSDAVVLGTPIYKASYSGLLKVWLDSLGQYPFRGKTILPLATGGSLANVLALDYALRPVLASMGATHVAPGHFVLDQLVNRESATAPTLNSDNQLILDHVIDGFLDACHAFSAIAARQA